MRTLQSQIVWCTRAQRTLIMLACAAAVVFYLLGYRPLTNRQSRLYTMTLAHEAELRSNQSKAAAKNEIAAKNERLRQELDEIRKPSKQSELPEVYKELTLFGLQSSLKKFEYKPMGMAPARNDLCELPLSLTFEGDFVDAFNFLRRTEDMQRLIRVRSLSLKSAGRGGGVKAQLAINIYFSTD